MITVHHLNHSRSQRVLWLLEELGLTYELVRYERDPKTMLAPPELKAVHPLGKAPVVVDGDAVLAESGAIIEHLAERYDRDHDLSAPAAGPQRDRERYWLHYAEGSLMPPLLLSLVVSRIRNARAPFFVRPIARRIADKVDAGFVQPQLSTHLGFLEAELGRAEWFAGDRMTIADIQMSFPVQAARARLGLERYPRLQAFLQRIEARPAYRRALERGGPFDLLS
ncbi:glutathione S-transferase family protein [Pseudofulvimonas gallinarii]|jgi:glutathione S-transferase|uniref:glutathione transferase n=1 Tax=Pseudofulvimonas gallinarii TaxID=634155 RepID=A0A4S3KSC1_9GAMM|nr:glutathione S-transferase [Pseudofulvimonas gallinarii]TCT00653.1 glutathione S-transferase [Pseudofulvimonas gallinarii]THD12017.1 glutathione S-transferase [Pseudofulvimonas gallinarii]